jgi:hypothetical protein
MGYGKGLSAPSVAGNLATNYRGEGFAASKMHVFGE